MSNVVPDATTVEYNISDVENRLFDVKISNNVQFRDQAIFCQYSCLRKNLTSLIE